ncbi:hypothetical protein [Rhizomonospora bruguierae]|uniref:hypothetical protein n=1 Tax=Rhizomonospora bruguierae TaxID=1581705 RepID=UPI001BD15136|nr:hypothetical protein [Micromonospora sp. NBRC 107566]
MRLTVGSLPPAVYWRRRAIVLTIVLSVIFVFVYACSDGPNDNKAAQNDTLPSQSPTPTMSVSASAGTGAPTTAGATPSAHPSSSPPGTAQAPPAATSQMCSDQEMLVTPVPSPADAPRGGSVQLTIKIKNVSKRTCKRDVGADFQEIRIVKGGGSAKVWSSDDCDATRGSEVLPFTPNFERAYTVTWNTHTSTTCDGKRATGKLADAGDYQVFARLGSKLSAPVTLTLN